MKMPTVSFVYNRRRTASKTKEATVEICVTYNYKQKYISTGVRVLPKQWKNGTITNRLDAIQLNKVLQNFINKVTGILSDMITEGSIDLNDITQRLKSDDKADQSFIAFCEERLKVREYGIAESSRKRYERFFKWFKEWGKIKTFRDITDQNVVLMDKEVANKDGKVMKDCSKWFNYHRYLNSFILDAIAAGKITRNPYNWVKIKKDKQPHALHKFLTLEEMHRLETAKMGTESLEKVRDLFVFQTYTCLSYTDLANFDLKKGKVRKDGRIIYTGKRGKTGEEYTFLLLEPAMAILKKYNGKLPVISNINYNKYLKVVAQTAGIDKPITTHWARHTGATIMLNEGVDMETVAKIMGHSSTKITRSTYAKLLDDTVAKKMLKAEKNIEMSNKNL